MILKIFIIAILTLKTNYCIFINKVIRLDEINLVNYFSSFECGVGICKAQFRIRRISNEYSMKDTFPNIPPIGMLHYSVDILKFSVYNNILFPSTKLCNLSIQPKMTKNISITPYWSEPINISLEQTKKPYFWHFVLLSCDPSKIKALIAENNQNNKWKIAHKDTKNKDSIYIHIQGTIFQNNGSHGTYSLFLLKNILYIEIIIHFLLFIMIAFYIVNKLINKIDLSNNSQTIVKLLMCIFINSIALYLEIINIYQIQEYGESKTIILFFVMLLNNTCKLFINYILFSLLIFNYKFDFSNICHFIGMSLLILHSWLDKFPNYYLLNLDPNIHISQKNNFICLIFIALLVEIKWYIKKYNYDKLYFYNLMKNIKILGYLHLFIYPISQTIFKVYFGPTCQDLFTNMSIYISRFLIYYILIRSIICKNVRILRSSSIELLPIVNIKSPKSIKKTK